MPSQWRWRYRRWAIVYKLKTNDYSYSWGLTWRRNQELSKENLHLWIELGVIQFRSFYKYLHLVICYRISANFENLRSFLCGCFQDYFLCFQMRNDDMSRCIFLTYCSKQVYLFVVYSLEPVSLCLSPQLEIFSHFFEYSSTLPSFSFL